MQSTIESLLVDVTAARPTTANANKMDANKSWRLVLATGAKLLKGAATEQDLNDQSLPLDIALDPTQNHNIHIGRKSRASKGNAQIASLPPIHLTRFVSL